MTTDFDNINPLKHHRAWTGRLVHDRGTQLNTLPNLNIDDGLEITEELEASQSHKLTYKSTEVHKAEFHSDYGPAQTVSGSLNFQVLRVNGVGTLYSGSFKNHINQDYLYNTASNTINFPYQDRFYTVYVNLLVDPVFVGQPILQLDFSLSGSLPYVEVTDGSHSFLHHQSFERTLRQNSTHIHITANFGVYVCEHLYSSGAHIIVSSDGNEFNIISSSLALCEG